jgi:RHS repeat-associated protein
VSDDTGTVVRQEEFNPFGARQAGNADGLFEEHFQGLRTDQLVVAGARAYDPEIGTWLARDMIVRDPQRLASDVNLTNTYSFNASNPFRYRDPTGMDPTPQAPSEGVQVFYVAPDDITHTQGAVEWRWSIAGDTQKQEYENAMGKFLKKNHVVTAKAKMWYQQISTFDGVADLKKDGFGSAVFVVHGAENGDAIGTQVVQGLVSNPIHADDFAKEIGGAGWNHITILGCDAVTNQFAPHLAADLSTGGRVTGYAGELLEVLTHTEKSRTPGVLRVTRLWTKQNPPLQSFKTSGP